MRCKNCNKEIDLDSKFCPHCGEKIDNIHNEKILNVEKEFLDHLEFLGYEINKHELNEDNLQRYSAIHIGSKPNLVFNAIADIGISFCTFYNMDNDKIKKNHKDALEIVNRMNNQALFCSFSFTPDLKSFMCSALYLGKYNKKQFADFLNLFEADIQGRFKAEDYLKNFSL